MSSVEAAANLFGSDDANLDPFASLGNESEQQDDFFASNITESSQSTDAPHSDQRGSVMSQSTLSHDGSGAGTAYGPQSHYDSQPGYGNTAGYGQHSSQAGSQPAYGSTPVTSPPQSRYDPYSAPQQQVPSYTGAHSGYDTNNAHPASTTYGTYSPAQGGASSYSPYAPQNAPLPQGSYTSQQAAPAYNAYAPQTTTSNYSPYAPQTTTTAQTPYAPSHTAPSVGVNAYASSATSSSSYHGAPSTHSSAETSYNMAAAPPPLAAQTLASLPPPPKPVAPLNRPKPNAYDPPFPTGPSRRSQRNVTPYEQPMYGSQAQAASLPPPPPRSPYTSPVQRFATSPSQGPSNIPTNSAHPVRQPSLSSSTSPGQFADFANPPPLHNPPLSRQSIDATTSYDGHQHPTAVQNKVSAYSNSRPNSRQGYERYTPSPLSTSRVISPPHDQEAPGAAVINFQAPDPDPDPQSPPTWMSSDGPSSPKEEAIAPLDPESATVTESPDKTLTAVERAFSPVGQPVSPSAHSDTNGAHRPYSPSGRYTPHTLSRMSSPDGGAEQDSTPVPLNAALTNTYASPPSRALSPALSVKSTASQSAYKPSNSYSPVATVRNRSTSNGSVVSNHSTSSINGSYGSTHKQPRRQPSEVSDYGDYSSRYNYPQAPPPGQSPYAPPVATSQAPTASAYAPSAPAAQGPAASPYAPPAGQAASSSPYAPSLPASSTPYAPPTSASDPYAPTAYGQHTTESHAPPSVHSPPQHPALHNRGFSGSMSSVPDPSPYSAPQRATYDQGPSQDLTVPSGITSQYAPSPSLIGSNDPLGRTSARIPVFSFGFGGRCVTCFHGASNLETGFDVALTSRISTAVELKHLNQLVTESALSNTTAVFPGPLFMDPGASTSLVRTGLSSQASITKAKKAKVLKYLTEREEELAAAVPYLHAGSVEHGKAEGKLTLIKLLAVMVEHDGQLGGSAQIDVAIRGVLVPSLKGEQSEESSGTFTSVADMQGINGELGYAGAFGSTGETISTSTVRSTALEKIQSFLLRGERRKAYHYALDQKLWAHAMVISSSIDKEAWQEAVSEFLRTELGPKDDGSLTTSAQAAKVNGWEGLRVAYSLFSGTGAGAVQELVPQKLLSKALATGVQLPLMSTTPGTPNFPSKATSTSIPAETLSKWTDTAAMMFSNPLGLEAAAALTSLGDHLAANGWTEAAHSCYLLSPQSSPVGGVSNPAARVILVGAAHPTSSSSFHLDQDAIILTEIVEFALSLSTTKGHEAFSGLPHLQPYRLLRALSLAEIGNVSDSKRYCEAITTSLNRSSPYFTPAFLEQLRGLLDRITAVPQLEKGGSWIPGKVAKPSLDTIGGWLEGRITKLIAGDGETFSEGGDETARPDKPLDGPFAHYSSISSNAPSTSPSPAPSLPETQPPTSQPPRRSGSTSSYNPMLTPMAPPSGRSSSAMDFTARRSSPSPRIASAGPGTTTFSQSASFSQAMEHMHHSHQTNSIQEAYTPTSKDDVGDDDGTTQEVSWWGQSTYGGDNHATPTATTFMKVDNAAVNADSEGFISLMDGTPSYTPSPSQLSRSASHIDEEEVEDLGFGNSKNKQPTGQKSDTSPSVAKTEQPAPPSRPDARPAGDASNSSWFGRWWRKEGGPVRANLGEDRSIYYDTDLKKWVNKNASADSQKPAAPPPPPSRVQTASPSTGGPPPPASGPPSARSTPPPRATSAVDLGASPPSNKSVMRVRSNLVPTPESAPSTPTGMHTSVAPPPANGLDRPRSQASKRNIRNRYVDILQ